MAKDQRFGFKYEPFLVGPFQCDGNVIGEGSFAHVLTGRNLKTGAAVAVKVMKSEWMQNSSTSWRRQLQREVELLTKIIHPNCVRLLMTSEHPQTKAIVFVFEWCDGGDLEAWINRNRGSSRISEANAQIFISQLSQALHFLKSLDILHRDLKPSNLLLLRRDPTNTSEDASNYILKVGDFGLSRQLSSPFEMAATLCGTRQYMAPEVAKSEKYTFKSDLYSVGIIMFRLLAGALPSKLFPTPKEVQDALPAGLSPLCVDLVCKLLHPDQDKRIEWEEFILHPWLLPEAIASPPAPAPVSAVAVAATGGGGGFTRSNSAQRLNSILDPIMKVAEWADSGADTANALVLWTAAAKLATSENRLEMANVCMERALDAKSLQLALSSATSKISTLWTALYNVCIRYLKETGNDEMISVQRKDSQGLIASLDRYDTVIRLLKFGSAEAPNDVKQNFAACLSAVTKKADSLRARLGR